MQNIDKMSWCLKNNVIIEIDAIEHTSYKVKPKVRLTINNNGKLTKGQVDYIQNEKLTDVIIDLYVELEKRLNK